jgi:tetratricopeptide (TPR) repeat protein
MKHITLLALAAAALLAGCAAPSVGTNHGTTHGSIALDNLGDQLQRQGEDPAALDLWLLRLQFLADYRVLDRAAALAEARPETSGDHLQRARARMAVHRFADAQADLAAGRATPAQRATLLVATGRAAEALPALQAEAERRPGFTSHCALARGLAAVGRLEEADSLYARALGELQTTLPFPAAAIAFARGLMWSEQGGDKARAAGLYAQALRLLPDYAAAGIHLAEIELAGGDEAAAEARLLHVVIHTDAPEAMALLGELHVRQGNAMRGQDEIAGARRRLEALLARHPQAFADHAAEFYLGPGRDPQRAWAWASTNLNERGTRRAYELAIRAAEATGRDVKALAMRQALAARHAPRAA